MNRLPFNLADRLTRDSVTMNLRNLTVKAVVADLTLAIIAPGSPTPMIDEEA